MQRVVSALMARETDPARPPMRRAGTALFAGLLVAALTLAGFAVWGLLQPGGSTRWRDGRSVIVEKESGAKYAYLDGRLHPVANYASALLIVGAPATVQVARRSLAGVARGAPLGIVGAPDAVPRKSDLLRGAWQVCSRSEGAGVRSVVRVGAPAGGGEALGDGGLLVSTPDGGVHLVWQGRRSRLREPEALRGILVWGAPVPVAAAFVNALPAVADLARVPLSGRGRSFGSVAGARVGQVFLVDGRQHAVALQEGLAPVTAFQAALLLGDPATVELVGQKAATPLSAGEYAAVPRTSLPGNWAGLPVAPPRLAEPPVGAALCAVPEGEVTVGASVAGASAVRSSAGASSAAAPSAGASSAGADEVFVPPGRGVLVAAVASAQAPGGALYLVTESGVRHAVPAEALPALGYDGVTPVQVPAGVLALLPSGAALDPQAARTPLR
ncbi:type VII secretion protein EccB [Virgisporangium aliadipatigenens]|uniref:Type VII secretion protein EccB n=2 Tax=Virgisporangium aliadipatigenens TaxID=741659 RepID=A0A8J3YPD8_9ACTN|nr:type VII secretion protein EccB [Virgisporangium aliadipatigenens]